MDERLKGESQEGGEVFGKDFGMKILIDGEDGLAAPVFDFEARFESFVVFFDGPALMVEFFEEGVGEGLGVEEGSG